MLKQLLIATSLVSAAFGAENVTKSEPDIDVGRFLEVRSINFGKLSSRSEVKDIDEEILARLPESALLKTTKVIGLQGNLSSSSNIVVGCPSFIKKVEIFHKNKPHQLIFEFTRLKDADDRNNHIQYSTTISTPNGIIKRQSADGERIDRTGVPMVVTFDERGELSKFDFGQPTETDFAPNLHIQFEDDAMQLCLDLGQRHRDDSLLIESSSNVKPVKGILSAYEGSSLIWQEFSKIESTLVLLYDTVKTFK